MTTMPSYSLANLEGITDREGYDVSSKQAKDFSNWIKKHPDENLITNVDSVNFSLLRIVEK